MTVVCGSMVFAFQSRRSTRAVRVECNFSEKVCVSDGAGLDLHEFGQVEEFFREPRKTVETYRYALLAYICK